VLPPVAQISLAAAQLILVVVMTGAAWRRWQVGWRTASGFPPVARLPLAAARLVLVVLAAVARGRRVAGERQGGSAPGARSLLVAVARRWWCDRGVWPWL
jgi:hypothetical protein